MIDHGELFKDSLLNLNNWMKRNFNSIRSNFVYTYYKLSGPTTINLEEFSEEKFVFFFSTFSNSLQNLVYNDPVNFI